MEPVCLLCRSSAKPKDRRKVHSPSTGHIIPVLDEFLSQLRPLSTEIVLAASAFLCRPCVRNVEKLLKLREDVMKKEAELLVDRVGEAYGTATSPYSRETHSRGSWIGDPHL